MRIFKIVCIVTETALKTGVYIFGLLSQEVLITQDNLIFKKMFFV